VILQALDKRLWVRQVVVVGELRFKLCGEGWMGNQLVSSILAMKAPRRYNG
jgi:hypothetical protein